MRIKEYGLFAVVILSFGFLLLLFWWAKGKDPVEREIMAVGEERTVVR